MYCAHVLDHFARINSPAWAKSCSPARAGEVVAGEKSVSRTAAFGSGVRRDSMGSQNLLSQPPLNGAVQPDHGRKCRQSNLCENQQRGHACHWKLSALLPFALALAFAFPLLPPGGRGRGTSIGGWVLRPKLSDLGSTDKDALARWMRGRPRSSLPWEPTRCARIHAYLYRWLTSAGAPPAPRVRDEFRERRGSAPASSGQLRPWPLPPRPAPARAFRSRSMPSSKRRAEKTSCRVVSESWSGVTSLMAAAEAPFPRSDCSADLEFWTTLSPCWGKRPSCRSSKAVARRRNRRTSSRGKSALCLGNRCVARYVDHGRDVGPPPPREASTLASCS